MARLQEYYRGTIVQQLMEQFGFLAHGSPRRLDMPTAYGAAADNVLAAFGHGHPTVRATPLIVMAGPRAGHPDTQAFVRNLVRRSFGGGACVSGGPGQSPAMTSLRALGKACETR